jgi:hypothetical protein
MPLYTADFRTDADHATRQFAADTPEHALTLARQFYDDNPGDLMFREYDGGHAVTEIAILDSSRRVSAIWRDDDKRLASAAQELYDTLASISDHRRDFAEIEDSETMLARIEAKARAVVQKVFAAPRGDQTYYCPRGCNVVTTTEEQPDCAGCGSVMSTDPTRFNDVIEAIEVQGIARFEREMAPTGLQSDAAPGSDPKPGTHELEQPAPAPPAAEQPKRKFNVHVYREMRLYFPDIQAATTEEAAGIAIDLPTEEASLIEDCEGRTFAALVDLVGDSDYRHSHTIDAEDGKLADKARQMFELLAKCVDLLEQHASARLRRDAIQEIRALLADDPGARANGVSERPGIKPPANEADGLGIALRKLADAGLTFGDCIKAFAARGKDRIYADHARLHLHRDGECEIDYPTVVSRGDDRGAYVQAWLWIDDSTVSAAAPRERGQTEGE